MQIISIRKARDLRDTSRAAVENLLGRKVGDEEQVAVMAFPATTAPVGEERDKAVRKLIEDLDALAASASHVPPEELDTLIDEAIEHVRRRRP
ncbi:MAG: hypothetical protein AAB225_31320 [Acidobacteriota bacterium]